MNQAKLDQELLKAIQYNKLGLVKRLHSEGASVNCRNEEGRSPLHLSVYNDWDRVSHFLIDMGADLNAKGKFGGTPLHMAAFKGNLPIVQLMLKKGADLRSKDSNGNLPIHLAAMYGWADIVEVFVRAVAPERWPLPTLIVDKAGDDEPAEEPGEPPPDDEDNFPADIRSLIQARSTEGETPLHHAAVNCHTQAIDYLLRLGADPEAKDNEDTPPQLYQPGKPESFFKVPAYVRCMNCAESIKLDGEEQRTGIYFCPYCEQEVDHLNFGKQTKGKDSSGGLMNKFGGWFSSSEDSPDSPPAAKKPEPEPEPNTDAPEPTGEETLPEHDDVEIEQKLIPENVHCAICRKSLKLDEEEQRRGIYFCPYCKRDVDHIHDAD